MTPTQHCLTPSCPHPPLKRVRRYLPWKGLCERCAIGPRRAWKRATRGPRTSTEYLAGAQRMIVNIPSNLAAAGDINDLVGIAALAVDLEAATQAAVLRMIAAGYSWREVGEVFGMTKQGAQQRWGRVAA